MSILAPRKKTSSFASLIHPIYDTEYYIIHQSKVLIAKADFSGSHCIPQRKPGHLRSCVSSFSLLEYQQDPQNSFQNDALGLDLKVRLFN